MGQRVQAVIYAKNIGPGERKKFGKPVSTEKAMDWLLHGSGGVRYLMSRRNNPDDNVICEDVLVNDRIDSQPKNPT